MASKEEKKRYYSNKAIQYEIVKCLKNRELCMLSHRSEKVKKSVRFLLAFSVEYLNKHFKRFDFHKSMANLYHSVALFKPNVPVFSYNLKIRNKEESYKKFNKDYKTYVEGYNLFIDCDGDDDYKKALKDAQEIKILFDKFKLPYYVLNSSKKGFHFQVPAEYMPKMEINKLIETLNDVVYNFKGIYGFETIDTSVIDLKRVCKCPYSYVQDGSVALPLTDSQLANFKPEMVESSNILNSKLFNRGLLLRTHGLSKHMLKICVKKFIDNFK